MCLIILLMESYGWKRNSILWFSYATHYINLILYDISKLLSIYSIIDHASGIKKIYLESLLFVVFDKEVH